MKRVVFDASVVLAWLRAEARPAWVDRLAEETHLGQIELVVPPLFWLEVGNALARDRTMTDDQAIDGFLRIESLGVVTLEADRALRLRALQLARQTGLTMYDATYLALADSTRTLVATLDKQLRAASESMGLSFDPASKGVSETGSSYGSATSDPVSLAAIGAALAELRKRYAST
jgi:predicted nucleic acid-binding protein